MNTNYLDNKKNIIRECLIDRNEAFKNTKTGLFKKNGIDLLVKMLILSINSCGLYKKKGTYIFVNETKNSNMSNNLLNTMCIFQKKGENVKELNFYRFSIKNHYKNGIFRSISLIIITITYIIKYSFILLLKNTFLLEIVMNDVYDLFVGYFCNDIKKNYYILMSDSHFYSTIIAILAPKNSSVIQHGIISSPYAVRASNMLVWSKRQKEISKNKERCIITGTYKFLNIITKGNNKNNTFLFCVSSLNYNLEKKKVDNIIKAIKNTKYNLIIKCHPGSLFDLKNWVNDYPSIKIYKEELLTEIEFDYAITGNSTSILDFSCMKKPFILYDNANSYFGKKEYGIPSCNNYSELKTIIDKIDSIPYDTIFKKIIDEELNSGKCTIYNKIKKISNV